MEEIDGSKSFSFINKPFYGNVSGAEVLEASPVQVIEECGGIYRINREVFNPDADMVKKLNKELKKLVDSLISTR
ncbi:MAG: hypothetical protein LBP76_08535 [Treponema sp.]|nr:hypothetical protein [Treponema sp.]